jgi:hypothetical protein
MDTYLEGFYEYFDNAVTEFCRMMVLNPDLYDEILRCDEPIEITSMGVHQLRKELRHRAELKKHRTERRQNIISFPSLLNKRHELVCQLMIIAKSKANRELLGVLRAIIQTNVRDIEASTLMGSN